MRETDNGFEFMNRFSSRRDLPTLFEMEAARSGSRHKLVKPYTYTPRHNGKVDRSHRENQRRFYDTHRFYTLDDFTGQLAHIKVAAMPPPYAL